MTAYRILFVCTGNICRSPTAEAVLRQKAEARGWGGLIEVDSAGTHDYHIGAAPDSRSCEVAVVKGYRLEHLRGRMVQPSDFEHFDMLLALDAGHASILSQRAPAEHRAKVQLFLPYAGIESPQEVADPYYGTMAGFEETLRLTERGCEGLLARLAKEQGWKAIA
jgi:protein-tyrosine phosphatase